MRHTVMAVSAVAREYRHADFVVVGKPRRRVRHPLGSASDYAHRRRPSSNVATSAAFPKTSPSPGAQNEMTAA